MATTLTLVEGTPTAALSTDQPVIVPDEGEEVTANTSGAGKGPVRPGYQALGNRLARIFIGAADAPLHKPLLRYVGGDQIQIGPCRPIWFADGIRGSLTVASTQLVTVTADGWWYIYLTSAIAFEFSQTAPDTYLVHKTGDATRRYIGSYYVEGGTVVPFAAVAGSYTYYGVRGTTGGGAPAAYTAIDLATLIPPHARLVRVWAQQSTDNAGPRDLSLRPSGLAGTPASDRVISCPRAAAGTNVITVELLLPTSDDRKIDYKVAGAGAGNAAIWVSGWEER